MKYHPVRNGGDASATEKYKKINEAHEILSDPSKRQQYNMELQFGSGGGPGMGGGGFNMGGDMGDIFNMVFNGGMGAKMAKITPKSQEHLSKIVSVKEIEKDINKEIIVKSDAYLFFKEPTKVTEKDIKVTDNIVTDNIPKSETYLSFEESTKDIKVTDENIKVTDNISKSDTYLDFEESTKVPEKDNIVTDNIPKIYTNLNFEDNEMTKKEDTSKTETHLTFDNVIKVTEEDNIPKPIIKDQVIKLEEIYKENEINFYEINYHLINKQNKSLIIRLCKIKLLEYKIKDKAFEFFKIIYPFKKANYLAKVEYEKAFNIMYNKVSNKYINSLELLNPFIIYNDNNIWSFYDETLEEYKPKVLEPKVLETKVLETKVLEPKVLEPTVLETKVLETPIMIIQNNKEDTFINYNNLTNFDQFKNSEITINKKTDDNWIQNKNENKKLEQKEKLKAIAKDFANALIKDGNEIKENMNNNTKLLYEINIDCTNKVLYDCTNKILGFIHNFSITSNKFLDSTYIDDKIKNIKMHSESHQLFKKEFFNILQNKIGEHNMHIRFDKDLEDDMIFHIRFFPKFGNNYLSDHIKQIIKK
jgi:curved DNA-binding protein CbpA